MKKKILQHKNAAFAAFSFFLLLISADAAAQKKVPIFPGGNKTSTAPKKEVPIFPGAKRTSTTPKKTVSIFPGVNKTNDQVNNRKIYRHRRRHLPPGQAKKIYGGSARDYAPGQMKKGENDDRDDRDDRSEGDGKKNHHKKNGKHHDKEND